jgi:hypothetical protein
MNRAMTDEETEDFEEEETENEDHGNGTMTRKMVAAYLDCSETTVRRLENEGRLVSVTRPGLKRKFDRQKVMVLKGELQGAKHVERIEQTQALAAAQPDQAAIAIAQSRNMVAADIMASTHSHAERFFELSLATMKAQANDTRAQYSLLLSSLSSELERRNKRIEKLEDERTEFLETLDKMKKDEVEAEERRANRAMLTKAAQEAFTLVKAMVASKMSAGGEKTTMQANAVQDFFTSLSPEQQMKIFSELNTEQQAMLFAIGESLKPKEEGPST